MPYTKEFEHIIRSLGDVTNSLQGVTALLEQIVQRLDILLGICALVVAISVTAVVAKFAFNFITKKK